MRTEAEIFNDMYKGLGYEYYTASMLWKNGYEAYKMAADFGFDILAYNQKRKTFGDDCESTPYLFQVKMRRIKSFDVEGTGAGERLSADVDFYIKKEDVKKIIAEDNAFLVCYFVDVTTDIEEVKQMFVMTSKHLKAMYECKIPIKKRNKLLNLKWLRTASFDSKLLYFRTRIVTQASSKSTLLSIVDEQNEILEEAESASTIGSSSYQRIRRMVYKVEKARGWIERSVMLNNNSNPYINIFAVDESGEEIKTTLRKALMNFEKFNDLSDVDFPSY